MASLTLTNVIKRYGHGPKANQVIHGVNAAITDGEFIVIVGPSGCGKSTLLRMVAGLEDISGGEIRIGERVVNKLEPAERDIAMVFQNYALYPHMSVFENMAYGLKIKKLPAAEIPPVTLAAPPSDFGTRMAIAPPATLAVIGVIGSGYVVYLGWETVHTARRASDLVWHSARQGAPVTGRQSLQRGATVNALNPHPYLFWATVGGPTLLAAFNQSLLQGALFLLGFYAALIGSKVAVAALVHSQSRRFSPVWYERILVLLGLLLIGLGVWLGAQAVNLAGL